MNTVEQEYRIRLLDATLRDGGFGLEDAYKNRIADVGFAAKIREHILLDTQKAKFDIIEIGSLERNGKDNRRFENYETIEEISANIPNKN